MTTHGGKAGGHGVLCVGYNDDDPENRYWIMLNSWGVSGGGRPNGIFRMDMDMNYDGRFYIAGEPEYSFYWQTLDIAFGAVPSSITGEPALVTATSAMLTGTVNPSMAWTDYYFEYGTSAAYGQATEQRDAGSGSSDVSVSAEITGLSANTPYHYRLAATNSAGTNYGEDRVFVALPPPSVVTTGEAVSVTSSAAMLTGTLNPGVAVRTDYYFEYGTSVAYGQTSAQGSVGSGSSDVSVSAEIAGLSANTPYHYRLVAANGGGTSYGEDGSFTTATSPSGGDGGGGGCFIATTADGFR